MGAIEMREVEATLLLLSEARERAERGAQTVVEAGGAAHVAEALERVDRELLALHRSLLDGTVLHAPATARQLELHPAA